MLHWFLTNKDDQHQQIHSTTQRRIRRLSLLTCCWSSLLLGIFAVTVVLSLIPIFLQPRDPKVPDYVKCSAVKIVFVVPANSYISDGVINSTGLALLQNALQEKLQSSSNAALPTAQILVNYADVSTVNSTSKKKRDLLGTDTIQISTGSYETGERLLSVVCQLVVNKKYGQKYCRKNYVKDLQSAFITVTIPSSIWSMIAIKIVPVSRACTDSVGYLEPTTGYTCQTYVDYGFCNGSSVVTNAAINAVLAEENCCSCGKGITTLVG